MRSFSCPGKMYGSAIAFMPVAILMMVAYVSFLNLSMRPHACLPPVDDSKHLRNSKDFHSRDHVQDLSWIDKISLGKILGYGVLSMTFEAIFDEATEKQYVVKISGDNMYTGDLQIRYVANEIEVIKRLSPHPSIPEILHCTGGSIPNPFSSKRLDFWPGASKKDKEWILDCTNITVIVEERFFPTIKHQESKTKLIVPPNKIRCFFRRLFEILNYAHEHNVMQRDINLINLLIQDGDLKMYDWNEAIIFNPEKLQLVFERKLLLPRKPPFENTPPENRYKSQHSVFVNVHGYDVWVVGNMIRHYVEDQQEEQDDDKRISDSDRRLLEDLASKMMIDDPEQRPTLKWLLDNHEYFAIEKDDDCKLSW